MNNTQKGCHVPYEVFLDPDIYRREQELIFRGRTWSFVALEAEIPNPGDIKTTFIGDTPVIVTRDKKNAVHVVVNSCAHRGALVCRALRDHVTHLECVYHQWSYDLEGNLIGLPFRRGIGGRGGMPEDFEPKDHGLRKLRVESISGFVFATFSDTVEDLRSYLGPAACGHIERVMNRPIRILGDQRQHVFGNWKLYAENSRDPYHGSLLHLFHATFGTYRSTQSGSSLNDEKRRHSILTAASNSNDETRDKSTYSDMRSYKSGFKLQDPSLLAGRKEFNDDITLVILSLFPNVVLQQIQNTLAVRQIVTDGPGAFQLVWTHFGYADDDEEMRTIRLKQANLIGPAGLISMEDGEAVEIVQASIRERMGESYIAMGGGTSDACDHLITENNIIGFWEYYEDVVGLPREAR